VEVVGEAVVERKSGAAGAVAGSDAAGQRAERDELVAPVAQLRDLALEIPRPDEEMMRVTRDRYVGHAVVRERERRQTASRHNRMVAEAVRTLRSVTDRPVEAPPRPPEGSRILANTAYRALADAGSKIASVALYIVMARKLGEAGFGVFTFAFSLVLLATTLADFGQDRILTREVARDRRRLEGYFANTIALKLTLAVPVFAFAVAAVWLAGVADATTALVAGLLAGGVAVELLARTCFAVFQAYERLEFVPVVVISQRFLTAAAGIAALLAGASVVAVAAIYLGGALVALAAALRLQFRRVARPVLAVEPRAWSPLMRAALPVGLAGVFSTVLFRADMTMLAFYEAKEVVGNYGAAYRLFESTLFLAWAVGAAVFPVLSRLTPASDPPVARVFERSLKLVIALTLPVAVGALVLAEPVVRVVYGTDYEEAVTALRLLAPAIALYPVAHLAGFLLVGQDRQRVLTMTFGLVAIQNVAANFVLIPWLSLDGAALGTSLSQALVTVTLTAAAARAVGGLDWPRVLAGPLLAGAAAGATMAALVGTPALAIAAAAAVYAAVLGGFEHRAYPRDARAIWEFVQRGRRATTAEAS
jgi:O-antigen/teichoic acid export membrane protein